MSIIESIMREEYDRSKRFCNALNKKIASLPKGYLRKKIIRNNEYWYLQYRDGSRVISKYIRKEDLEKVKKDIALRNEHCLSLKEHMLAQRQIERALGKDFVNE